MRLVADTNVLVSGLLWLGNPGQVLEAAASGRVTVPEHSYRYASAGCYAHLP